MAGKFSMPRFDREDLDSTQELPQLPEEFDPIAEDPIPDYDYRPAPRPQQNVQRSLQALPQEEYDPEEDLPEDFIDVALRVLQDLPGFFQRHWKKFAIGICTLILVVLAGVIGSFAFQARDPYDEKILNNVMIADVLVGGMTKEEAVATLNADLANRYASQSMVIQIGEQTITLSPADTGIKFNAQAAVEAAYAFGRTGTEAERENDRQIALAGNYAFGALTYLDLDKDHIRSVLAELEAATVSQLTQTTYTLEGEATDLSTDSFDPAASAEILVITLGTPQVDFDTEALYDSILDHYSMGLFRISEPAPTVSQEPDPIDLDAIYQRYFLEPEEATLNMTDFTVIPGSYGRDFDLDAAKLLLAQAEPGQELRIPMTYPKLDGDPTSVLYRDTLGTWTTELPSDENWKKNVQLAVKAVNGIKLKPNETFSFHAAIGQPSEARGYVAAPLCGAAELGGSVGEGTCQLASTLYVSALLSELDVTSRTAHSYPLAYTQWGLDADVKWGGADLVFRNNSIYPIRLEAEMSGSSLTVRIIGTDMRSYRTDMEVSVSETIQPKIIYEEFPHDNAEGYKDGDVIQEGRNGNQVKTYRCKYAKDGNSLVGRDYIATSSYASQDTIIARVAPPVEALPDAPPSETISGVNPGSEAVG